MVEELLVGLVPLTPGSIFVVARDLNMDRIWDIIIHCKSLQNSTCSEELDAKALTLVEQALAQIKVPSKKITNPQFADEWNDETAVIIEKAREELLQRRAS